MAFVLARDLARRGRIFSELTSTHKNTLAEGGLAGEDAYNEVAGFGGVTDVAGTLEDPAVYASIGGAVGIKVAGAAVNTGLVWLGAQCTAYSQLCARILLGTSAGTAATITSGSTQGPELNFSNTVLRHADRPYRASQLLANEIMATGPGRADPQGVSNVLRWDVPGAFAGQHGTAQGVWELVVDMSNNTVLHFLFRSKP